MAMLALPRQWQSYVDRLRARLAPDGLLDVLDSFPPPSSFEYQDTTIREQKAVRLCLGEREQDDATRATSWAYIVHESPLQRRKGEPEPPVFIRDESRGSDDTTRLSKRAATSLLRKAVELLPPFCFLQFDSQDKATHVRDMLCALVLYYSLVNGLTETAIKWSKFESSLVLALEYIDDSASYQRWQNAQNTDTEAVFMRRRRRRVRPQRVSHNAEDEDNTEDEIDTATSDSSCKRGVVYSLGSAISVKPDSHLAKLITALGDRASLLDAIPSTAIIFNRQNLVPEYCPIMLKLGTYDQCVVHVCLTQGVKGDTRILAQDPDGHLLRWKFEDLTGIDLVEPFHSIMRVDQELKSRGSKIRYLVFYYFMLAEHAGLIGKISAPWKHESMVPGLRAACNRLRKTSTGDTTDEDVRSNASELQEGVHQSLIVKLRINPHILIAHIKTAPVTESEEESDNYQYPEEIETATSTSDLPGLQRDKNTGGPSHLVDKPVPADPAESDSHTGQEAPLSYGDTAQGIREHEELSLESSNETYVSALSRAHSRDSLPASSPVRPVLALVVSPNALPSDAVGLSDMETSVEELHQPETTSNEKATPDPAIVGEEVMRNTTNRLAYDDVGASLQVGEPEPRAVEPNPERRFVLSRAVSVLSISSDEEKAEHPEEKLKEETFAPQKRDPGSLGRSEPICLSSDEEIVLPEHIKQTVERTPEIGAIPRPPRPTVVDYDSDELRWPGDAKRKRKRSSTALFISNDDDDLLEADGNAWKTASLGRSGGKGH